MTEGDIRKLALVLGMVSEIVSVKTGSLSKQDVKRLQKQHGFNLELNPKTGFYDVRYKDLEENVWLRNRTCSYFSTEFEAIPFAIDNRERIVRQY